MPFRVNTLAASDPSSTPLRKRARSDTWVMELLSSATVMLEATEPVKALTSRMPQ